MKLEGSCHCGAVRYRVEAPHPYPYNCCYCNACRKTAGTGGYAINLGARAATLEVEGREHVTVYRPGHPDGHEAQEGRGEVASPQERHFCGRCGTALWIQDPRWPELVHPHAGAVDTPLPTPPERVHLMLDFKAAWVDVPEGPAERCFARYPDESLAAWHARHGLAE